MGKTKYIPYSELSPEAHAEKLKYNRDYYHKKIKARKPKNVYYDKSCKLWRVQVGVQGKDIHCGSFHSEKEALKVVSYWRKYYAVKAVGMPEHLKTRKKRNKGKQK